jgi:hypothetical protein
VGIKRLYDEVIVLEARTSVHKLIRFTRHARQKFDDLAALGFPITEDQVVDALQNPEHIDSEADPPIAQKAISERHLVRVVFVETEDVIRIVTFYPARRTRYESEDEV